MTHCFHFSYVFKKLLTNKLSILILLFSLFALYSFGQTQDCNGGNATGEITVGTSCNFVTWDSNNNTDYWTPTSATCGETDNDDVWGWFIALTTSTTITYSPDTRDAILTLFTGGCSTTMTPLACSNTGGDGVDETIVYATSVGIQYKVRVQRSGVDQSMTGDICVYSICNQPTVTAATNITSSTATINWTAATPAPGTGYEYVVSTSNTTPAGSGTATTGTTVNVTGLIATTTYYVFVRSNCGSGVFSSWDGPISFTTTSGPTNDECSGAIALSVGAAGNCSYTTYSNNLATASAGVPAPTCANYSGGDVWFTVVVPASGALVIDTTTGVMLDSGMEIYSGTCGTLVSIECDDDGSDNGAMSFISRTGLTPGSTIYIRVWEYGNNNNGTFGICAYDPPIPCNSITNIANCGTAISATIAAGNGAYSPSACGIGAAGGESIYTYTPVTTGNYNITQNSTFGHINYSFRAVGASCDGSGYTCIADLTGNNMTSASFTLIAGTQYYIMLDSEDLTGGSVNFTLDCSPLAPSNDLCANATNLLCLTIDSPGTTIGSTNVAHGTGCTMSNYGVWYTFVGDGDQSVISTKATAGFDQEMSISFGSCGSLTNITCQDANGSGGVETYSFITTPAVTYYVYVAYFLSSGGSTNTGDFTITRICNPVIPPGNDDPCGAINLNVNAQCIPLNTTNEFASATSGVAAPSCGIYSGGDVWFTVTVPASASITIETTTGTITDSGLAVYSGTCLGTLTEIDCDDDSGSGLMSQITLTAIDGIIPGQVLYVRFWEDGNDVSGSFGICAYDPSFPAGDNGVTICQGSTSQLMSSDIACSGTTSLGNTITGNLDPGDPIASQPQIFITSGDICSFDAFDTSNYDVIPFTVTQTATYTFTMQPNVDLMGYIVVAGTFTYGSCATGTWIAGDDDSGVGLNPLITATLQAGVPYEIITAAYCGCDIVRNVAYQWNVATQGSEADWYTVATGGTVIATGATFDPVGVAGSGLTDTNTPGTYTYYVACPGVDTAITPRTPIDYVIKPTPTATISGVNTGGCVGSMDLTITVSDSSGATQWYIEYTDGTSTFVISPLTSPHTFSVSAPAGTTYTLVTVLSFTTFCSALPADMTGSATVVAGGKTWDGSASTDWFNANNWTPVGVPSSIDCVVIPNVTNDPIINGTSDANVGSISVLNGGYLLLQPGATITVVDEVTVVAGGTFELDGVQQNSAQLIQVNDVNNTGNITLIRETNVRSQDFVYWSSPVENFAVSNIASSFTFDWTPTFGGNPGQHGDWGFTTENMIEGKGYAVRGPNGPGNDNNTASWQTIIFTGVAHNGNVSRAINRGSYNGGTIGQGGGQAPIINEDDQWNLVGNPYSSSLDAVDFLNTNTNIQGTVYIWSHGTRIQGGGANNPFYGNYSYNYNQSDYLEYNASGPNPNAGGFNGYIGSAQGFYIQMLHASSTPSTVTFDNSMRSNGFANDQFFRNNNNSNRTEIERHRIWLDLVTPSENTSTTLLAYAEGATNERDRMYDASVIGGYGKNIYSRIEDTNFSIQGRSIPLDINDEVSLGIYIDEIGEHAIAINSIDGLFETTDQEIFIEDLALGIIHNIKESPYFFTINETGAFNDRFVLRFIDNSLTIDEFNANSEISIIAPNSDYIKVTSGNSAISNITVYDMLGRVLVDKTEVNTLEYNMNNFNTSDGTLFVKVTLVNGKQKIKKVVIRK